MEVCTIITARGGSKGIPRKNLVEFSGKPLIGWTIAAALQAGLGRVIVSTDSEEIAAVSRECGAEVPFLRPSELATDSSGSYEVVEHALKSIEMNSGLVPEIFVLLQPTSPFRTAADIIAAVKMVNDSSAPAAIGVCEAITHPWMARKTKFDGSLESFVDIPFGVNRRQDFPPAYMINGALYVVRTKVFFQQKSFEPIGTVPYVMSKERSLDIDAPEDLAIGASLAQKLLL